MVTGVLQHIDNEESKRPSVGWCLEERKFDAQEFFGIFSEFSDQRAHISCKAGDVVVHLWILEQFACGVSVLVELGSSSREIGAGLFQLGVKRIVSRKFAQ